MAISTMQQPRQMYGLGSFVKKAVRKVTKPFTKVARKIVPREVAGIMRVAAPFLPAGFREAAYLLGTAKQTGRISPIDLALVSAPYINKALGSQKSLPLLERKGLFAEKLPGANEFLFGAPERTLAEASLARTPSTVGETTGILGTGGKMFQFGSDKGSFLDNIKAFRDKTKLGSLLLEGDKGTFSKSKIAGLGIGTLSLIQNSKTPDEAGKALAASTGNSDDYERGAQLFAQLTPELFEVPEQFRMNVKDGGRIKFNQGTGRSSLPGPRAGLGSLGDMEDREFKFDAQEFMVNKYKEDGTKPNIIAEGFQGDDKIFVIETPNFGTMTITMDQYLENFGIPERQIKENFNDGFGIIINTNEGPKKITKKDGGLMRTNFAMGSDDDPKPLPEDPTKPVNPFAPKPIKPLGDMKMAGSDRYQRILEDIINEMEDALGRELTNEEYDLAGQLAYEKLNSPPGSIDYAKGGRVNYALGTRPTAEESGLGGLPIEADMRYTGGFMPYGAKEKADDVPARLSKNEFVFTADAVRAAGGGSVNEGAKKMYQTMKQLEAKPEAKGMMA